MPTAPNPPAAASMPQPVILPVNGVMPRLGPRTWLAPNCTVVGDVTTGEDCSIWFGAVVRGDVCAIHLGDLVNVQDGAVLHGTFKETELVVHDRASIGHNAIVHGCTVGEGALIGMGAIVMDRAVIGKGAVVAAGAVVLEGTVIGSGELWAGVPARKVKEVADDLSTKLVATAARYAEYAQWFSGSSEGRNGVNG